MPDRCERFVKWSILGRWAGILLVVLSLCIGCGREEPRPTVRGTPAPVKAVRVDSVPPGGPGPKGRCSPGDTSYPIRDMVRGSTYAVHSGSWSSFLTLCSDGTILDTISTYGSECGTYGHTITLFDSTFLVFEAICRGNSGTGGTEVYCVVDGEFKLAAAFHSNGNVAVNQLRGDNDGYHVGYEFRRRPYRLNLTESFRLSPEEAGRPDHREHYKPSHWERHYQLRFDTTDHFFYSDSIRVADVWLPGEKRTLDGTFPGFALVYGSYIHTDNDWYDFQNDLFDEEESFVSGRMKPQKVIHRESDDTLRQR